MFITHNLTRFIKSVYINQGFSACRMLMKNLSPVVTVISVKIESHTPLKEKKTNQTPILCAVQETQSSCQYNHGKSFPKEMLRNTIFNCFFFSETSSNRPREDVIKKEMHQMFVRGLSDFQIKIYFETKLTAYHQETKILCKKHPKKLKKLDFNPTS